MTNYELATLIVGIIASIATLGLAFFALRTFIKTKDLVGATIKQAEATEDQAKVITREYELRTRPWINLLMNKIPQVEHDRETDKWRCTTSISVNNIGSLPAINCAIESEARKGDLVLQASIKKPLGVIFPDQPITHYVWFLADTEAEAKRLAYSLPPLHIRVCAYYQCLHDDSLQHKTINVGDWNMNPKGWACSLDAYAD